LDFLKNAEKMTSTPLPSKMSFCVCNQWQGLVTLSRIRAAHMKQQEHARAGGGGGCALGGGGAAEAAVGIGQMLAYLFPNGCWLKVVLQCSVNHLSPAPRHSSPSPSWAMLLRFRIGKFAATPRPRCIRRATKAFMSVVVCEKFHSLSAYEASVCTVRCGL
jgi:hypothetical protein